jgi:hypothetical protein
MGYYGMLLLGFTQGLHPFFVALSVRLDGGMNLPVGHLSDDIPDLQRRQVP